MLPKRVRDGTEIDVLRASLSPSDVKMLFTTLCCVMPWRTHLAIIAEWSMILFAMWLLFRFGATAFPITLVIVGTRQRGLSTLLHEAGHCLMASNRRHNDVLGNLFLAFPLFDSVRRFRGVHVRHHFYLGDSESDADFHHAEEFVGQGGRQLLRLLFSPAQWFTRGWLGALPVLGGRERILILCWWSVVLTLASLLVSKSAAFTFALVWIAARVTVFYGIGFVLDFTDHVGLRPGTIAGFTRTCSSVWGLFWLHPYWNGFHLAHHLVPGIPWYNLRKAHHLLLTVPLYAAAHHCDGYLFGAHTALQCINRDCNRKGEH